MAWELKVQLYYEILGICVKLLVVLMPHYVEVEKNDRVNKC